MDSSQSGAKKKRILVVEDELGVLDTLDKILTHAGYEVVRAGDGEQGIFQATVQKRLPDLILADIMMPRMNGYEMHHYLRSNLLTRRIPFIFVTAKVARADKALAFSLGAPRYIFKPFTKEQILEEVSSALADKEARDGLTRLHAPRHSGSLAEASVYCLLDLFYVNHWGGKVQLTANEKQGVLCFEGGELQGTRVGQKGDWTALEEMLSWKEGTFDWERV